MKNFESVSTVDTYEVPEMTNYDYRNDQVEELSDAEKEKEIKHAMDYEGMKGEATYVSPEEASPEALKRIKAMQTRGRRLTRLAGILH